MTGYQSKRLAAQDKLTGERRMKVQEIIDYAYPNMMSEKHLKQAHQAMLDKDFEKALDHTHEAIAQAEMMMEAIKEMRKAAGH